MYDKLTVLLDKIWSSDFAVNIIGGLLVLIIDLSVTYLIIGSVIERRERKKYGMARKEYAIEFLQQYSALKQIVPSSVRDLENGQKMPIGIIDTKLHRARKFFPQTL